MDCIELDDAPPPPKARDSCCALSKQNPTVNNNHTTTGKPRLNTFFPVLSKERLKSPPAAIRTNVEEFISDEPPVEEIRPIAPRMNTEWRSCARPTAYFSFVFVFLNQFSGNLLCLERSCMMPLGTSSLLC